MIHPTAVIHPQTRLDASVVVGPYAVIDEGVTLGPGCLVGPHVHLTGRLVAGANNRFHTGCVIGDAPQDLRYRGQPTGLRIGEGNVFREHVTVSRSAHLDEDTVIGSHNLLMAHSHVGHNSVVGNHVILANGALLGGHVQVLDRAFISGHCLVHQFVRVGTLAMMQGGAAISKDLPPFCMARGDNGICGLNVVGLRRSGFDAAVRLELKRLYHQLFRHDGRFADRLAAARELATSDAGRSLLEFIATSKRGLCRDVSRRSAASDNEE